MIQPKLKIGKTLQGFSILANGKSTVSFPSLKKAKSALREIRNGSGQLIVGGRRISMGLGDALAFSGAAVVMAKEYGKILLPFIDKYRASIESIYVNYPEVRLIEFNEYLKTDDSSPGPDLLLGYESINLLGPHIDQFQRTYNLMGIPYEERWNSCPVPEAVKCVTQNVVPDQPYLFLHDDVNRGFIINHQYLPQMRALQPEFLPGQSILVFANQLEGASEIHLIDSAFFHLVEQLQPIGRLFLHRYARNDWDIASHNYTRLKHHWNIL